MMRKVQLPAAVVGLLALLLIVTLVQGWRMAAQRQDRLLPRRATVSLVLDPNAPAVLVPFAQRARFLTVDLGPVPPARLGLYQILPERSLVRWIEESSVRGRVLVVPLRGLQTGFYAICAVDPDAAAGPREMDLPAQELDVLARFELR